VTTVTKRTQILRKFVLGRDRNYLSQERAMDREEDTTPMPDHVNGTPGSRSVFRARTALFALIALIAVAALVVAVVSLNKGPSGSGGQITVSGTATVVGAPDTATFQIGVHTTNHSASLALTFDNRRVSALEKAMMANGVTKLDMQTSGLSISENTNGNGNLTGFTVVDTLNVTMHDLTMVGAAIEAGARVAGNGVQLNDISFSISDTSPLYAMAREQAMGQARAEAGELAGAAGASLNGVLTINASQSQPTHYLSPEPLGAYAAAGIPAPIETGSQSITVSVSAVYALAN
jgi:uncharacterized protein